jgi:hypothetical protein
MSFKDMVVAACEYNYYAEDKAAVTCLPSRVSRITEKVKQMRLEAEKAIAAALFVIDSILSFFYQ